MVMGEPCPPFMRQDIRTRLMTMGSEAPTTNNGYGLTETQGPAMECVELGGMHQPSPEQFFFEVIDRDTGEPLPDGEPGMMLVSHLNRRGNGHAPVRRRRRRRADARDLPALRAHGAEIPGLAPPGGRLY